MFSTHSPIGYPNVLGMIMAGGEGSRLHPLTRERAKPSVYFGGKYRIIDFVLNNFINSGIFKIKVLTQFKSDSLIKHLTGGWNLNRMLGHFIDPVPAQMRTGKKWYQGTADAVFQNINLIADENPDYIAVFGADHIYTMDISQMLDYHRQVGAVATVCAIQKPIKEATQFGVIEIDHGGRMIGFQEKPASPKPMPEHPDMALVSMGNYIFNKKFLVRELFEDASLTASSHDFGRNVIPKIFAHYPIYVYNLADNRIPGETQEQTVYWEDVGTIEAYYQANMVLRDVVPVINLYNENWPIRTAAGQSPPAKFVFDGEGKEKRKGEALDSIISGGCIISGGKAIRSVLSRGVRLHSFSVVEDSIIFPDADIGDNARVRRAIIDRGIKVKRGDRIGFDPEEDRKRFFVSDSGIVILSQESRNLVV
ncbi:MAG: glucose-1-phosphate adenylyltransferase [Chitinispirillaceae bacterium]|nr:glucose-1-phosphate adenylyltransferase [Chitinispirillaceae bacterium]